MGYAIKHIVTIDKGSTREKLEKLAGFLEKASGFRFAVYDDHLDDYDMNGHGGTENGPLEVNWKQASAAMGRVAFTVHCFSEDHAIWDYLCYDGSVQEYTYRETDAWYKQYKDNPGLKSPGANQNYYKDFGLGKPYKVKYGGVEDFPAGVEWWKLKPVFLE